MPDAPRMKAEEAWAVVREYNGRLASLHLHESESAAKEALPNYERARLARVTITEGDGWQEIESAPKDGTRIRAKFTGGREAIVRYAALPLIGEGWFVQVPAAGGWGEGHDTMLHWDEDMPVSWMAIPGAEV